MKTIYINTSRPYNVHIGAGLIHQAGAYLNAVVGEGLVPSRGQSGRPQGSPLRDNETHPPHGGGQSLRPNEEQCKPPSPREVARSAGGSIALITDTNVNRIHGDTITASLVAAGFRVVKYVTRPGEGSKSMTNLARLLNFLAEEQVTRTDTILAFGGGVVGDLAGFAAASYLRGVRFVQFATSLLAAVDSSVGGKTGVNLAAGKNLAGAFWQPEMVLCDTDVLLTQRGRRFMDGVAEVIKHAIIADPALFARLGEKGYIRSNLAEVVARNVEIKASVVSRDELERGERALLNLGHTVGHAIERLSAYKITHGYAVAMGMAVEARAAARMGVCSVEVAGKIEGILAAHGFDLACPYDAESLAAAMLSDKKRSADTITFALPQEVGKCVLVPVKVGEMVGVVNR
ncbi:MAG: 3-dehydroquinate synthase [Oscillospiraceae bacterium]|nr:3-dehydroquinate synthase [Oscillospiraceae bacterium]